MNRYRAVFFDRDGTLSTHASPKAEERDRAVGKITGKSDFRLTDELKMRVFWHVMDEPGMAPVNTLARERGFWLRWYQIILEEHGVVEDARALAAGLHEAYAFHLTMELFPETGEVLAFLKARGYRLGVISDTFPSLEDSLKALGIAGYFDSFTASSIVGAGKPDPRIFNAAMESLGVRSDESIFVDDCKEEADGAREQGFTAFHLDRKRSAPDWAAWTVGNLGHVVEFLRAEDE